MTYGEKSFVLTVKAGQYVHGGLAVQLTDESDGEFFTTVSIFVHGLELANDEFVFKTYSENEGLLDAMLAAGIVEHTGRFAEIGPICRLLKGTDDQPTPAESEQRKET